MIEKNNEIRLRRMLPRIAVRDASLAMRATDNLMDCAQTKSALIRNFIKESRGTINMLEGFRFNAVSVVLSPGNNAKTERVIFMKKFPFFITVFALISASIPAAYAWTNPTANPASGAGAVFVEAGAAANAIYIKSNGNVGIGGTTNPGAKLEISADLSAPALKLGTGGDAGRIWTEYKNSGPGIIMYDYDDIGGGIYFRESPTTGSESVPQYEAYIVGYRGNIGIGTATPTTKLDVNGTIKATSFEGALSGTTSAANISAASFGANTGGGNYTFPGTLTVNGNVTALGGDLISNTTGGQGYPDVRLQGAGTEVIERNDGGRLWLMTATTGSMRVNISDAYDNDRGLSLTYAPGSPAASPTGAFDIGQTQKNHATYYSHGITRLYTNGLERVRIDADGDVGIGSTSPTDKLEVITSGTNFPASFFGASHGGIRINAGSASGEANVWLTNSGDTADSYVLRRGNAGSFYLGYYNGIPTYATDPSAIHLAVNKTGEVGIGVTAPTAGLDVRKAITAATGAATGTNLQQTLTASANNDALTALKINPTFVPGIYTGTTQYAIDATGTIKATAFEGGLSGTVSAGNVSSGDFGSLTGGGNYGFPANLTADTDTFFVDSTNNRVGVGTTSPGGKLAVASGVSDNIGAQFVNGAQQLNLLVGKVLTGAWPPTDASTTMTLQSSGSSAGNLAFATGNSEIMRVTSTGRVGIGTATPATLFHVSGTSASRFEYSTEGRYISVDPATRVLRYQGGPGDAFLVDANGGSTTGKLQLGVNASAKVTVLDSGNVGIGTSAPIGRLDVSSATGSGANTSLNIIGTGTGAQTWSLYPSTSQSLTLLRPGLRLATFLNDGGFAVGGLSDDIGSGADFYVNGTSGNVGIGTIAPGSTLEVKKIISGTSSNTVANFRVENSLDPTSDKVLNINIDNTENFPVISLASSKQGGTTPNLKFGSSIFVADGYPLENGKVGIGTTSPAAGLDVQKAVTASGLVANGTNLQQTLTASANNDVLTALRINPTFVPGIYTGVTQYAIDATGTIKGTAFEGALSGTVNAGNVSSGGFGSLTGGGNYTFPANLTVDTDTLFVDSVNNRVGIGTVTPLAPLHIYSSGNAGEIIESTGNNYSGLQLKRAVGNGDSWEVNAAGSGWGGVANAGSLAFYNVTDNAVRAVIDTSGNVGIGTINPGASLNVGTKTTNASSTVAMFGKTASASEAMVLSLVNSATGALNNSVSVGFHNGDAWSPTGKIEVKQAGASSTDSSMNFYTYNSGLNNRMTLDYLGRFGIGTAAPATLLHLSQGAGNNPTATIEGTANGTAARLDLISNAQSWRLENQNNKNSGAFSVQYAGVEKVVVTTDGKVGIGTTAPVAALDVGASGGIRLGGVTRTTWPGGLDAPIYTNLIYGSAGDLPWRTTSTVPQTMRVVYKPFQYAMPSCPSGYTKQHRLYGEVVDNISTGGQAVYVRMLFDDLLTRDFSLGSTWGGSPSYKTYLSALFTETNINHASIQAWINGVSGPYLEIRRLELRTYCI